MHPGLSTIYLFESIWIDSCIEDGCCWQRFNSRPFKSSTIVNTDFWEIVGLALQAMSLLVCTSSLDWKLSPISLSATSLGAGCIIEALPISISGSKRKRK